MPIEMFLSVIIVGAASHQLLGDLLGTTLVGAVVAVGALARRLLSHRPPHRPLRDPTADRFWRTHTALDPPERHP